MEQAAREVGAYVADRHPGPCAQLVDREVVVDGSVHSAHRQGPYSGDALVMPRRQWPAPPVSRRVVVHSDIVIG